ncbi:hypothetical protein Bca52824_077809 [Brassica carinata]|uniref:Uncharacterized protein n=1 Tax=Brassica carinata TaxID=52824 RepID=A0A8X7PVP2_BRACI|nr:hypothetical protein Bca52824_077809 [Brassica carinata]
MFSSDQISKAHFHLNCSIDQGTYFTWYTGVIEGRPYSIKIYTEYEEPYNDIAFLSARVSNHSGFLKLIGRQLRRAVVAVECTIKDCQRDSYCCSLSSHGFP